MICYIYIIVLVGVIILNRFVYKYLNIVDKQLNIARKFFIGMVFASISMCIAGIVEILRQHGCLKSSIR